MAKVESPVLLRSRLRNTLKNKSPEKVEGRYGVVFLIFSSIRVEKIENRKKKTNDTKTSLKLRGKSVSSPADISLLKSKSDSSPQERKLHTPIKSGTRLRNLDSPEPIRSGRFSLRKTPARLKYLDEHSQHEDDTSEDVTLPEYTPLRSSGVSMNQLRGSNDMSTPAINVLENARMTRQRAKKAIQKK